MSGIPGIDWDHYNSSARDGRIFFRAFPTHIGYPIIQDGPLFTAGLARNWQLAFRSYFKSNLFKAVSMGILDAKKCSRCYHHIPYGSIYCPKCGKELDH